MKKKHQKAKILKSLLAVVLCLAFTLEFTTENVFALCQYWTSERYAVTGADETDPTYTTWYRVDSAEDYAKFKEVASQSSGVKILLETEDGDFLSPNVGNTTNTTTRAVSNGIVDGTTLSSSAGDKEKSYHYIVERGSWGKDTATQWYSNSYTYSKTYNGTEYGAECILSESTDTDTEMREFTSTMLPATFVAHFNEDGELELACPYTLEDGVLVTDYASGTTNAFEKLDGVMKIEYLTETANIEGYSEARTSTGGLNSYYYPLISFDTYDKRGVAQYSGDETAVTSGFNMDFKDGKVRIYVNVGTRAVVTTEGANGKSSSDYYTGITSRSYSTTGSKLASNKYWDTARAIFTAFFSPYSWYYPYDYHYDVDWLGVETDVDMIYYLAYPNSENRSFTTWTIMGYPNLTSSKQTKEQFTQCTNNQNDQGKEIDDVYKMLFTYNYSSDRVDTWSKWSELNPSDKLMRAYTSNMVMSGDDVNSTSDTYDMAYTLYYGVDGIPMSSLQCTGSLTYGDTEVASTTIIPNDLTVESPNTSTGSDNSVYTVASNTVVVVPNDVTLTVEEGATLVVARNSALILNGNIECKGTILVQPGGMISYFGETDLSTSTIFLEGGDLVVRSGGKVRIARLTASVVEAYDLPYSSYRAQYRSEYNDYSKVVTDSIFVVGNNWDYFSGDDSGSAKSTVLISGTVLCSTEIAFNSGTEVILDGGKLMSATTSYEKEYLLFCCTADQLYNMASVNNTDECLYGYNHVFYERVSSDATITSGDTSGEWTRRSVSVSSKWYNPIMNALFNTNK